MKTVKCANVNRPKAEVVSAAKKDHKVNNYDFNETARITLIYFVPLRAHLLENSKSNLSRIAINH